MSSTKLFGVLRSLNKEIIYLQETQAEVQKQFRLAGSKSEKIDSLLVEEYGQEVITMSQNVDILLQKVKTVENVSERWDELDQLEKPNQRRIAHALLDEVITQRRKIENLPEAFKILAYRNRHLADVLSIDGAKEASDRLQNNFSIFRARVEQENFEEVIEIAPELQGEIQNINVVLEHVEESLLKIEEFLDEDKIRESMAILVKSEQLLQTGNKVLSGMQDKLGRVQKRILTLALEEQREMYHTVIQRFYSESEEDAEKRAAADDQWLKANQIAGDDDSWGFYQPFTIKTSAMAQSRSCMESLLEQ